MNNQELYNLLALTEQAILYLAEGGSGEQYDPSWMRPRKMTVEEIKDSCIKAYHWMNEVKRELEAEILKGLTKTNEI
jgi:hypothetical protein